MKSLPLGQLDSSIRGEKPKVVESNFYFSCNVESDAVIPAWQLSRR